ncbi:MAG TPA: alpha-isopropylmalate synthase regulatory domain-containing protein [Paludibacteraceae bacterium]|nr:alpha-isopropylmalate synthase regulatory domain-containing protein [Paludibacteraceae bacterium]HPO68107.1 alpha-isopropylmalate synthase regulatory domain-containing protein [Paludibacteraceae bacterium]HRR62936.1 alpha-isopropylmalate synthase regulatory domain-containing protein [Paludibacteraceae bacterium]
MIEIMDTTLRDGEQTSGVSFSTQEKLSIARMLLEELCVDRIEIASARVSEGEFETVKRITEWAKRNGYLNKIEILGFVDGKNSLEWIQSAGGQVVNLLCKGSLKHCTYQLKKTPEQHVADIEEVIFYAQQMGMAINIYLEDWSNGIKDSEEYVFYLMDELKNEKIQRFMLPDTLGILNPDEAFQFCKKMIDRYPHLHFDFHAHNDYDLAVANVYEAVKAGVTGVHTTINGLGERAGNAPLSSVLAVLHDHLKIKTNLREDKVYSLSKLVATYSGIRIPHNKPVIGENVFTQVAGIHADGDNKSNLYYNDLLPERFGRHREYALGKNSGKANILKNLQELGIELDEEMMRKVTERVIELGDKKQFVTMDDLPYIVSDVLNSEPEEQSIKLLNYSLSLAYGLRPVATVKMQINGEVFEQTAAGEGQYNAVSKAMWKIYKNLNKPTPELLDYEVVIPPGGQTNAIVQTIITWKFNDKVFKTRGLDGDQTVAAIKATMRMLNLIEHGHIHKSDYENLP